MRKRIATFFILALIACTPINTLAWGMLGHRIVGQIAEAHLSGKARRGIRAILGAESLAMASNWGDFIKSDTSYKHIDSWHYVNIPAGLDQQDVFNFLEADSAPNLYNKIPEMIAVLKNSQSSLAEKKMAIRLLIHFVGDANQPMHAGRKEDLGGNRIYVTWFGERSNLHRVWDSSLIEYQQLSYTEYAAAINHAGKDQLKIWKSSSLRDFVYGSYQASNKIYEYIRPDDKLSYRYNYDFVEILNAQLLKGGICLANILNDIYR